MNADATDQTSASTCLVCQQKIMDNQWFCRLPQKPDRFLMPDHPADLICAPGCALKHFHAFDAPVMLMGWGDKGLGL